MRGRPSLLTLDRLAADGMEAEFCKILEHIPDEGRFPVRAGVGWEPASSGGLLSVPISNRPPALRCKRSR
jgi:hypothetical protein